VIDMFSACSETLENGSSVMIFPEVSPPPIPLPQHFPAYFCFLLHCVGPLSIHLSISIYLSICLFIICLSMLPSD
jgi:hypothetical protein